MKYRSAVCIIENWTTKPGDLPVKSPPSFMQPVVIIDEIKDESITWVILQGWDFEDRFNKEAFDILPEKEEKLKSDIHEKTNNHFIDSL